MFKSKNCYSDDLTRYYTSDPYRIAFLLTKGCKKGKVNGNDPNAITFEIIATQIPIPRLIDELHTHPVIDYDAYIKNYKAVMAEIRDIRSLKKEKVGV